MAIAYALEITQVVNGRHYRGKLTVGNCMLDFEMQLPEDLAQVDKRPGTPRMSDLQAIFPFEFKRGDESIALSEDEHLFFMNLLVPSVIDFWQSSQTRNANEEFMNPQRRDIPGIQKSIGMSRSGTLGATAQAVGILSVPKFEGSLA